jgi:hypothetical protein
VRSTTRQSKPIEAALAKHVKEVVMLPGQEAGKILLGLKPQPMTRLFAIHYTLGTIPIDLRRSNWSTSLFPVLIGQHRNFLIYHNLIGPVRRHIWLTHRTSLLQIALIHSVIAIFFLRAP